MCHMDTAVMVFILSELRPHSMLCRHPLWQATTTVQCVAGGRLVPSHVIPPQGRQAGPDYDRTSGPKGSFSQKPSAEMVLTDTPEDMIKVCYRISVKIKA